MWLLNAICEGFGCLPSAAIREMRSVPYGLLWDILDARAYRDTRQYVLTTKADDIDVTPMVELVMELTGERAEAEKQRRERGEH